MPAILFPFSLFLATFSTCLKIAYSFGVLDYRYGIALASCAAALALFPALTSRSRWRPLELLCLLLAGAVALDVIRPFWVSWLIAHTPILRSTRWPFRELLAFQFFFHLFLVLRPMEGSLVYRWLLITAGVLIFTAPLPFLEAPSFNGLPIDRSLLLSGKADRYWAGVKTLLEPGDVVVAVADPEAVTQNVLQVPFILLGGHNYPILFRFRGGSGYSTTAPRDQLYLRTRPAFIFGIFAPESEPAILAERPNVRFLVLESIHPLRITLSSKTGPPIELTKFLRP